MAEPAEVEEASAGRPDLHRHLHRVGVGGERITVGTLEVARAQQEAGERLRNVQPVLRGSSLVGLDPLVGLLTELAATHGALDQGRRSQTDAWLAPRLHGALRLTRREASDPGIWAFLAGVHPATSAYVRWRWATEEGELTPIRLVGRVNQQAISRLWWGAELFRDGADYRPVERAFAQSELINLCLHRPFVRNRAFALAVLEVLAPAGQDPASSEDVSRLAKNVTLVMPTLSAESATRGARDDATAYRSWLEHPPPTSFGALPTGPQDACIPPAARRRAVVIAAHIKGLTGPT
jgi:hypothetical protein